MPGAPRQWLLFVHQLPASPSNLRVRTWRRLQQVGAVPLRQTVYVLPDTPDTREDFEWLKREITSAGGQASVLVGHHLDAAADDELVEAFRRARQDDYTVLGRDIEATMKRDDRRPTKGSRAPAVGRLKEIYRQRLAAIEAIDYFGSAGRDRVVTLFEKLQPPQPAAQKDRGRGDKPAAHQGRLWVTRPRPGVDRMASAWLIRRFIDTAARFDFVADRDNLPSGAIAFDMFGGEFSHRGDQCTFETLCAEFGITDAPVARLAEIVHDLDLKDTRYGAAEAATVSALIDGMQLACADDHELLDRGIAMFESLYRAFEQAARPARPRPVAGKKKRAKAR